MQIWPHSRMDLKKEIKSKRVRRFDTPSGGRKPTTFINESGLYALINHLFVHEQLGLSECYIDREKGYIHVAHDASGFNV